MPVHVNETVKPDTGEVVIDPDAKPEFLDVSLLTFDPCFDLDREEWYIDVDLHPALATDPFVRFGLVRYQPHSISPNLMVSEPVTVWSQVLPKRTVTLTHIHRNGGINNLTAIVCGQASNGVKRIEIPRKLSEKELQMVLQLERPVMQMILLHEGRTADNVLMRTPIYEGPIEAVPDAVDGLMEWCLKPPKDIDEDRLKMLGKGSLVAYIEEIERRRPATYATEPISIGTMFDKDTIVSSGPRFSVRIVFHKI
jgi:hypothetical protein